MWGKCLRNCVILAGDVTRGSKIPTTIVYICRIIHLILLYFIEFIGIIIPMFHSHYFLSAGQEVPPLAQAVAAVSATGTGGWKDGRWKVGRGMNPIPCSILGEGMSG